MNLLLSCKNRFLQAKLFTFGEANEGEISDFEKWVLNLKEDSEMGDFEFAKRMMEVECEGGEGERFMTMAWVLRN